MQSALEAFLTSGVLAFMLTFMRIGTAAMIMPGIGDSFINARVRLHIALALSLVLTPLVMVYIPSPVPPTIALIQLIVMEMIIGLMIGTVARIFIVALDTAGMVISAQSGLANAQVFNPTQATQGSLIGSLLSMVGAVLVFAANLHHLLIMGLIESYQMFPMGTIPDFGSMAELIARAVSASFSIGVKLAAPFIVLTLLIYTGMGVLTRLMPQVQVFLIAVPAQILLALILLGLVIAALFSVWLQDYRSAMFFFFSSAASTPAPG
ncbi:MAG: flagellar biosynthetic protein FliR [Alphaproteobacteria bacterium]